MITSILTVESLSVIALILFTGFQFFRLRKECYESQSRLLITFHNRNPNPDGQR